MLNSCIRAHEKGMGKSTQFEKKNNNVVKVISLLLIIYLNYVTT